MARSVLLYWWLGKRWRHNCFHTIGHISAANNYSDMANWQLDLWPWNLRIITKHRIIQLWLSNLIRRSVVYKSLSNWSNRVSNFSIKNRVLKTGFEALSDSLRSTVELTPRRSRVIWHHSRCKGTGHLEQEIERHSHSFAVWLGKTWTWYSS